MGKVARVGAMLCTLCPPPCRFASRNLVPWRYRVSHRSGDGDLDDRRHVRLDALQERMNRELFHVIRRADTPYGDAVVVDGDLQAAHAPAGALLDVAFDHLFEG